MVEQEEYTPEGVRMTATIGLRLLKEAEPYLLPNEKPGDQKPTQIF